MMKNLGIIFFNNFSYFKKKDYFMKAFKFTNRLINEKSLYLLQHAHNPVDWYPWGDEAISRAREEDKLIFVSIGYSSCHWCHVMEKESFEDEEIAEILNKFFISIKIDREEFPDLDNYFMNYVQALTGRGGWPLNVFLTPDLTPIFGGTYFPPKDKFGLPSFKTVLLKLISFYKEKKEKIKVDEVNIKSSIEELFKIKHQEEESLNKIQESLNILVTTYDSKYGGFGERPKFPMFPVLKFLIDSSFVYKNDLYFEMVESTLYKILRGGIYDHVGGGIHRYSVDEFWRVPHFEKMLYDNAQLIEVLSKYYLIKKDEYIKDKIYEVTEFLVRELKSSEGGFYTALDADSENEEGKFYIWSYEELNSILNEKEFNLIKQFYNITNEGNFEGNIILSRYSLDVQKEKELIKLYSNELKGIHKKLFDTREKRQKPTRDNKILTDINSLVLKAFVLAYRATFDINFYKLAEETANFLTDRLIKDGVLYHCRVDNELKIEGYAEDYFNLINALLDFYEISFEPGLLFKAKQIYDDAYNKFFDEKNLLVYQQAKQKLNFLRTTNFSDSVFPSSFSEFIKASYRIGKVFEIQSLITLSEMMIKKYLGNFWNNPFTHSNFLNNVYLFNYPPSEVIIVDGSDNDKFEFFKKNVLGEFHPNRIIIYKNKNFNENFNYLKDKVAINSKITLYICENFNCNIPEF